MRPRLRLSFNLLKIYPLSLPLSLSLSDSFQLWKLSWIESGPGTHAATRRIREREKGVNFRRIHGAARGRDPSRKAAGAAGKGVNAKVQDNYPHGWQCVFHFDQVCVFLRSPIREPTYPFLRGLFPPPRTHPPPGGHASFLARATDRPYVVHRPTDDG